MDAKLVNYLTHTFAIVSAYVFLYARFRRRIKLRAFLRVVFPKRIWFHRSSVIDYFYYLIGVFVFPLILLFSLPTSALWSRKLDAYLNQSFGAHTPVLSTPFFSIVMGLTMFVVYEFTFWLNHYMSHKFMFLWEFHRVHHSAKVLTPFTASRVHIIDSFIFSIMFCATLGVTSGLTAYFMGHDVNTAALACGNLIFYIYISVYGHLQHSQLWLPFTGKWSRIFYSPAHHQIHHSNSPEHYDKNFGSSLAIFDWLFGTLYVPTRHNQKLTYGVDNDEKIQSIMGSIYYPFVFSWCRIWRAIVGCFS